MKYIYLEVIKEYLYLWIFWINQQLNKKDLYLKKDYHNNILNNWKQQTKTNKLTYNEARLLKNNNLNKDIL